MMDLCELQLKLSFSNSVSYYSAGDNGTSNKIEYYSPLAF